MTDKYSDPIKNTQGASKLKAFWSRLDHQKQKKLVVAGALAAFFMVCFIGYSLKETDRDPNTVKAPRQEVKNIDLDKKAIDRAKQMHTQAAIESLREDFKKQMEQVKKEAEEIAAAKQSVKDPEPEKKSDGKADKRVSLKDQIKIPPPPKEEDYTTKKSLFAQTPPAPPVAMQTSYRKIGGAKIIKGNISAAAKNSDDLKKKSSNPYLSPSFMEAVTLSGMAAPTTSAGKNNPLPIFLRIKAPAFLPNQVRSNLKGCFVFGEGVGDLADERVHVRLKTLSCVSKNNKSVIDSPIKGFLTDADGRVGLRGKVVAKMGLHAARAAFASFIEAAGEAFGQSAKTVSLSATGTPIESITDTDIESILTVGAGAGVADGAKQMKQLYVQLMEQTLPVIEVGSMKQCTVVISEGMELEIKEAQLL